MQNSGMTVKSGNVYGAWFRTGNCVGSSHALDIINGGGGGGQY